MAPIEYRVTIEATDKPTPTYDIQVWFRMVDSGGQRGPWSPALHKQFTPKCPDRLKPFMLYQELLRATLI
jgi:hypothetical protein